MKNNKNFSNNRKGDLAEYYAVTWLWDQGYEVFKNCGCDGSIDLIARDSKGNIKLIDVKTARPASSNPSAGNKNTDCLTKKQIQQGVVILAFDPDKRKLWFLKHQYKRREDNE